MAGAFAYRLFGLNLASELEFPELGRLDGVTGSDAEIRLGRLQRAESWRR